MKKLINLKIIVGVSMIVAAIMVLGWFVDGAKGSVMALALSATGLTLIAGVVVLLEGLEDTLKGDE